jgi:general secretion pathway protein G
MTSGRTTTRRTRRGFTLIELMVVIVILGTLMALVGPNIWHALFGATRDSAKFQVDGFAKAIKFYHMETRTLPGALSDLTQESKKSGQPFLEGGKVPDDPWGQAYEYRVINASKQEYEISSNGEDKVAGSADDLVYNSKSGWKE